MSELALPVIPINGPQLFDTLIERGRDPVICRRFILDGASAERLLRNLARRLGLKG